MIDSKFVHFPLSIALRGAIGMTLPRELAFEGDNGETPYLSSREDAAACRELLRAGSKSFYAASLLLPQRLRSDVYALYAFCRIADDEVDLSGGPQEAVLALRARLGALYAGVQPDGPVERSFAALIRRRGIPYELACCAHRRVRVGCVRQNLRDLSDVRAYGVGSPALSGS